MTQFAAIESTSMQPPAYLGRNLLLIDVREPLEFTSGHVRGSINLPLSKFSIQQWAPYKNDRVSIICESGNRARKALSDLRTLGFSLAEVSPIHIKQMSTEALEKTNDHWSVEQQFRFVVGIALLVSFTGILYVSQLWMIVPLIIGTGLTYAAISDRCFLKEGIARLPWNRSLRA